MAARSTIGRIHLSEIKQSNPSHIGRPVFELCPEDLPAGPHTRKREELALIEQSPAGSDLKYALAGYVDSRPLYSDFDFLSR